MEQDKNLKSEEKELDKMLERSQELEKNLGNILSALKKTAKVINEELFMEQALSGIEELLKGIEGVTAAIVIVTEAQKLWNLVTSMSPLQMVMTVAATAIAGIANAIQESTNETREAAIAFSSLSVEQQKIIDNLRENVDAWNEVKKTTDDEMNGIQNEFGYYHDLSVELATIVDQNGKIKKGYEERAEIITGQLSDALGIEVEAIDGQIKGYQTLQGEIDKTIHKKQLEAVMAANAEKFSEAKANQEELRKSYLESAEILKEKKAFFDEFNADLHKWMSEDPQVAYKTFQESMWFEDKYGEILAEYGLSIQDAGVLLEIFQEQIDTTTKDVADAENAYLESKSTIENYGYAMAAVAGEDIQAMDDAVIRLSATMLTAEGSTREALVAQKDAYAEEYEQMLQAVKEGSTSITQADLEEKSRMSVLAAQELDRWDKMHSEAAESAMEGFESEILEGAPGSEQASKAVVKASLSPVEEMDLKSVADEKIDDYASEIKKGIEAAQNAMQHVALGVYKEADINLYQTGLDTAAGYAAGIRDGKYGVGAAAANLARGALTAMKTALDSNSPSKKAAKIGIDTSDGYAIGIEKEEKSVEKASSKIAENVLTNWTNSVKGFCVNDTIGTLVLQMQYAVAAQTAGSSIYRMALGSNVAKEVAAAQRIDMLQSGATGQPIYVETHVQLGDETELAVALTPAIEKEMAFRS